MLYLQSIAPQTASKILCALLNAVIFWDILYRSQLLVTVSLTEEIGSQNLLNLLISPIRGWEWACAIFLYGLTKTAVIVSLLTGLSLALYNFDLVGQMGYFLPFLALNLVLFGWALGIFTCSMVIRWGRSADALIWGIPFLIQPLSAIYYPVSVLPGTLQFVSKLFPSTYVFEGMREILKTGTMPFQYIWLSLALNGIYFILGILFFQWMYRRAFVTGRLLRFWTE
ncbi:MAG TPA: ABC transporter permease, partial [Candidatus Omnitrophota bacterium]|nr:ABC transporter permease [Candidatus Omnitrophota bacterium]